MLRVRAVAILAFAVIAPAVAAEPGCVPDQHESFICGEGKGAIRIFPETIAPSGKLAFGWRTSEGLPAGQAEPPGDVEDVLVRLPDGVVLGRLGGAYWATGEMRANRYDLIAAWSPDSRRVVELANSRWETDSFRYYFVEGDHVTSVDLHQEAERSVRALRPRADGGSRVFRVREDQPVTLDNAGVLRFAALLFVPKSDEGSLGFRVTLAISGTGALNVRVMSARRTKLPD